MKNPLINKTAKKLNGTLMPLNIEVIPDTEAANLLAQVKRNGIYRPYMHIVVATLKSLQGDKHIKFHTPQIVGRTQEENCKRLMSVINVALKSSGVNHRLRHVTDTDLLVSEPVSWGSDKDN